MLALKDSDKNMVGSIKAKEALVKRSTFFKRLPNPMEFLVNPYR